MIVEPNICDDMDSYKATHWDQYPKKTETVYSYLESRLDNKDAYTLFYGLQIALMEYFNGVVVTQEKIDEAEQNTIEEFGHPYFNKVGWEYILNEHGGKLPLLIKAVPEGLIVPSRNVLMTIENTDPNAYWLTNYVETIMLQVWNGITVATNSHKLRELIDKYARISGTHVTPYHIHDFGFRGVSSLQSAGIAGSAHLVNFMGTDTRIARRYAKAFYNAKADVSGSVKATEHSVVTMYGRENELSAYEAIIDSTPDDAIVSIVSDSYNHWNALENYFGKALKDKILARAGKVVVRPDSGNPIDVSDRTLQQLEKSFGVTTNELGYKKLNPHVGMIYGDRITYAVIKDVLDRVVVRRKYSTDNIIFGMGKELEQAVNRDTYKFAFKASAGKVDGEWRDVYKKPITDVTKVSKAGRMKLIIDSDSGNYKTVSIDADGDDIMKVVFENGKIKKKYTFDEIRKRAGWNDYFGNE